MKNNTPIWFLDNNGTAKNQYPSAESAMNCDTVIVGGGLAGLLTAYHLTETGQEVIVLEGNRIMQGVSGHSTAKMTSQHDIIYSKLIKRFGFDTAKLYAEANQAAIERYSDIINKENISCEFERQDAHLFTQDFSKVRKLQEETEAAKKLGIDAHFSKECDLPIPVEGVMTFKNQAMFNPYDFGMALADIITGRGGKIFEHSRVIGVSPVSVRTDKATIMAKNIVIATNYPIINFPGWYFARIYQSRSYLMALENAPKLNGYYLSVDKDAKTFRTYKNYLLVGGQSHKTGKKGNIDHYGEIRRYVTDVMKNTNSSLNFVTQWSAQDGYTLDNLPYVGRYSKKTPNLYVAAGFFKWGITNSMVSAMILSDLITKGTNPWAAVYSPLRPMVPRAYAQLIYNVVRFIWNFISGWIAAPFKRTPTCTHMYCKTSRNKGEGTYDCACHGSRFSGDGRVINAPAKYRLR